MRRSLTRRHESNSAENRPKITREGLASFQRLLNYIKPYRLWMVLAIVTLLLGSLVNLLLPFVIRNLVDVVFGTNPESTDRLNEFVINLLAGGVQSDDPRQTLTRLMLGLFFAFLIQMVLSFTHRLTIAYVGERAIADIRVELYAKLQRLSLKFYADHRTGEIVSRITNDVTQLQDAVTNNIVALLNQVFISPQFSAFFNLWHGVNVHYGMHNVSIGTRIAFRHWNRGDAFTVNVFSQQADMFAADGR